MNDIILSPLAEKEIEESFSWYEENQEGLGERFIDLIDDSFIQISKSPEFYPKKKANFREFLVDKFPFLIIYEYISRSNTINILHVFHTSRNPKQKYKKSQ